MGKPPWLGTGKGVFTRPVGRAEAVIYRMSQSWSARADRELPRGLRVSLMLPRLARYTDQHAAGRAGVLLAEVLADARFDVEKIEKAFVKEGEKGNG